MGALKRHDEEGVAYHVTTAIGGREPVLLDPLSAQIVVDGLQFLREERAYVLAYAVLPDHVHVLLLPRQPYGLSQVMQTFKGHTAYEINRLMGRRGALWQKSFFDRAIRGTRQLAATVAYIEGNPVKEQLEQYAASYAFCSAHPGRQS